MKMKMFMWLLLICATKARPENSAMSRNIAMISSFLQNVDQSPDVCLLVPEMLNKQVRKIYWPQTHYMMSWLMNYYCLFPAVVLIAMVVIKLSSLGLLNWLLDWFRTDEEIIRNQYERLRVSMTDNRLKSTLVELRTPVDPSEWSTKSRKQLNLDCATSARSFSFALRINEAAIIHGAFRWTAPVSVLVHFLGDAAAIMDRSRNLAYMYVTEAAPQELDNDGLYDELKKRVEKLTEHAPVVVYTHEWYALCEKGQAFELRPLNMDTFRLIGRRLNELDGKPLPPSVLEENDKERMPQNADRHIK